MTLLDVHHGLLTASAVVQAFTGIVVRLCLACLAWQMLFGSGLKWRWFRRPQLHGKPVMAVRVSVSFFPEAGKFRRLPLIPKREPYEWMWCWMSFQVRWDWITCSRSRRRASD
jgi:hypothetical protein